MSRARFALLLTLLGVLVAAGSFAAGLSALDDGRPDPPPRPTGAVSETTVAPLPDDAATTVPTTAPAGQLVTPTWVTVVASEGDEATAQGKAALVAAKGYPTGVLHSDDYPSLAPGLWVTYAGPYPDRRAAEAAVDAIASDGFAGSYVRCVGTDEQCSGSD